MQILGFLQGFEIPMPICLESDTSPLNCKTEVSPTNLLVQDLPLALPYGGMCHVPYDGDNDRGQYFDAGDI